MKFFKKIFIAFLIILIIGFVSLSIYVRIHGKDLLQNALSDSLGEDVQIGKLTLQFPLGLKAHDVYVKDLIQVKNIKAKFDYDALRQGQLDISSLVIVNPVIMIARPTANIDGPEGEITGIPSRPFARKISRLNQKLKVTLRQIILKEGRIHYIDAAHPEYSFVLNDVEFEAQLDPLAAEGKNSTFQLTSRLEKKGSQFSQSRVEGSGWFNLRRMDMDGKLKIVHSEDKVGLTANIVSRNNDMTVEGKVSYSGSLTEYKQFENMTSVLPATGIKIGAKFSFATKMDDFQITKVQFSGLVGAEHSLNSLTDSIAQ